MSRVFASVPGEERVGWWATAGFALLALGVLLGVAVWGSTVPDWDVAIGQLVQRPTWSGLDRIAWVASRIGDAWTGALVVTAIAVAFVFWRGRVDLAIFIAVASASRAVGVLLKAIAQSPRPGADVVAVLERASGFGYPSGHALGAALIYGAIAVVLPQVTPRGLPSIVARSLALALALVIAWSRVRLGAHWFSDVVGGLLFGFGWVMLLYAGTLTIRERFFRT